MAGSFSSQAQHHHWSGMLSRSGYAAHIGGQAQSFDAQLPSLEVHAAADASLLAHIQRSDATVVDQAVQAAREALPAWRAHSAPERAQCLMRLADRLEAEAERFARIECSDTGRCISETRFDVADAIDQYRYFAAALRSREASAMQHANGDLSLMLAEPYGVVGLIVPWNFPLLIAAWKLAPALAAGNCVVLKPADAAPLSLLTFAELAAEVLPAGVLNVIPGAVETGKALTRHPGVDKLSFTGSPTAGRDVAAAAALRPIPVTLELGGKSANIVFSDALQGEQANEVLEQAQSAILYGQGQVCSAGSRLLVEHSCYDAVLEALQQRFAAVPISDPGQDSAVFGPVINATQGQRVMAHIETAKRQGARLLSGGACVEVLEGGYYIAPTLFADVSPDMALFHEEVFGPVLAVTPFTDEAEAIALANATAYGLAAAVWTPNQRQALRVGRALEAGTVWLNSYHLVPSGSAFGGYKQSGYGREVHASALEAFSQRKTLYIPG